MKNNQFFFVIFLFSSLISWNFTIGQAPQLGTAAGFVLFTAVGAVGNTGISQLTGNVGTNVGATTGFGNVNGVMHNSDAASAQCAIDLQSAWYQLDTITATALHLPVLGNGETLYPGVYSLAAAGSLVSVLILDAQGDSNTVFIFKTGGAFTSAASSSVVLRNGAVACNVFWKAEGAISLAASTSIKGTLIAHNGAIDLGAGCSLEGRAFSTTGAASFYGTDAAIPNGCGAPALTGPVSPVMGFAQCFTLFSANGLVTNSGTSTLTGDVGSNTGVTTGYNPLLVNGMVHPTPDVTTAYCSADLQTMQTYLTALPYDIELLYPAQFGNRLVLTPHTYRMNAAAVLNDTLYLDGGGNPDAKFVIQVTGALTTGTYARVRLRNGTQAQNVYWVVTGAVIINNFAVFAGTIICNAAMTINDGAALYGRALTMAGDIVTSSVTAQIPASINCSQILPVRQLNFKSGCNNGNTLLKWTNSGADNESATIERSIDRLVWKAIGKVAQPAGFSGPVSYSFTDKSFTGASAYYRLQLAGTDGRKEYGSVITTTGCGAASGAELLLYPNPSAGIFTWQFAGNPADISSISIFNGGGVKVYHATAFTAAFDLSNNAAGPYFIRVNMKSGTLTGKMLIIK